MSIIDKIRYIFEPPYEIVPYDRVSGTPLNEKYQMLFIFKARTRTSAFRLRSQLNVMSAKERLVVYHVHYRGERIP